MGKIRVYRVTASGKHVALLFSEYYSIDAWERAVQTYLAYKNSNERKYYRLEVGFDQTFSSVR